MKSRLTSTDLAPFAYHSALCFPPYVSFINLLHSSSPRLTSGLTSTAGLVFPFAPAPPRTGILGLDGPAVAGRAGLPGPELVPAGLVVPGAGLPEPVPGAGLLFAVDDVAFGGIVPFGV